MAMLRSAPSESGAPTPQIRRRGAGAGRIGPAEALTYLLLLGVLAAVLWLNQRSMFTPDIKPEVYLNPLHRLALDLGSWLPDPYLGTTNYNVGLAPFDAVSALLSLVGVSPENAVRLLRFVLYALAGWGSVTLFRRVAGSADGPAGRLTAAVVFVANPYAIVAGSTMAVLLPYALFPWMCVALLAALRAERGWRQPATAALLFVLMTGMNVGAVPILQLVAVPALVVFVRRVDGVPWGWLLLTVAKVAGLCLLLSAYWLVPAFYAAGAGQVVVENSETLEGIASTSSWAEVLRGLGLWPMYGGDAGGPWQPGFVVYLHDPFVIIASFLLPVFAMLGALWSRSRARVLGVLLVAVVAVVMVGLYPPEAPSPFGQALRWIFENVPGAIALRTTNKAGAGLALGVTLLIALGMSALTRRLPTPSGRSIACAALGGTILVAAQPALGQLYVGRWSIPSYWYDAAGVLNSEGTETRTWFVPGEVLAQYRWSTPSVDDVNLSFIDRRSSLVRTVLPTESAIATNFLAAADSQLQDGTMPPQGLSAYARYLGIGDVLLRNDVVWETFDGARPAVVQPQLDADTGLVPRQTFGDKGENVRSPGSVPGSADFYESRVPPLKRYEVPNPRPVIRTESSADTVLIDGDGWAIARARTAGLLPILPSFRYVGGLTPREFEEDLGASHRIVLTDTNRRTTAWPTRLTDAYGPLLPRDQVPEPTRALFGVDAQTTAEYAPPVSAVTATSYASELGRGVAGFPDLAFDENVATSWMFGAFGNGVGQSISVDLDRSIPITKVSLFVDKGRDLASVAAVEVTAGDQTRTVKIDETGSGSTTFRRVPADRVTVTVTGVEGEQSNSLGIREISIAGVKVRRYAVMPTSTATLADALTPVGRTKLEATPIDVVMQRARSESAGVPDEEPQMLRRFTLPSERTYRFYGTIRPDRRLPRFKAQRAPKTCTTIATIDGTPVKARALKPRPKAGEPWIFVGCRARTLTPGTHALVGTSPWAIDWFVMRDSIGEYPVAVPPSPATRVIWNSATEIVADIEVSRRPYWFISGQSLDSRWVATLDGKPLGPPTVLDGYAMAWRITEPGSHVVALTYPPQEQVLTFRSVSIGALLLVLLLILVPRRWLRAVHLPAAGAPPPRSPKAPTGPPGRWRRLVEGVVVVAVLGLVGGWPLAAGGVVLGIVHVWVAPRPRTYLRAAVVASALIAPAWLVGTMSGWTEVSPALVLDNPAPAFLAAAAIALSVLGVLDEDRSRTERA